MSGKDKNKMTIKDIAEIANVSPSAVSIALNDRKGIGDDTREKILRIVREFNYVPNQQARKLLLNYTNNICLVYEKESSPLLQLFLSEIFIASVTKCNDLGYNLVFSSIQVKEDQVELPQIIQQRDVDGIILLGDVDLMITRRLKELEIPLILVDDHFRNKDLLAVEADYKEGARKSVQYLINKGHRGIAYIGENTESKYGMHTLTGYRKTIEENNLDMPLSWLRMEVEHNSEDSAYANMKKIIATDNIPTAVFCAADIYAIGAIKAIKDCGLKVPKDISVTGMDNIILSEYIEPQLTTVDFNKKEMGQTAIEILIKQIKEEYEGDRKIIFYGDIIERESVEDISNS